MGNRTLPTPRMSHSGPEQINRNSKVPLYQQLYDIVQRRIRRGDWKPGDRIPSESELLEMFQVSRSTVRQVLELLNHQGFINRQPGRGTFVVQPTIEQTLTRIVSFTEDMRRRGFVPESRMVSSGLVPAPREIAERLSVEVGEELARLERLRLADGKPMSIEESFLVHRYCPGVLERRDYTSAPLRETLEQDYGIRLVRAQQTIRAIQSPPDLSLILEIPRRVPLLSVERVTFSDREIPIEFLRIYYRADRYVLYNELQG